MGKDKTEIKKEVRKNYSQVAKENSEGCCNSSGCCSSDSNARDAIKIGEKLGYSQEDLNSEFIDANQGLGCGNPKGIANLNKGETVLDLGCGAGFDVFLAAQEVGREGKVIGVDMTPEMIEKARENAEENDFSNVEFRLGEIEHLPVADNSIDVIISNCVINLSVNKEAVFSEIYRVLKPEGRIAISDILKSGKLPQNIKDNVDNYSNCLTGAINPEELKEILEKNNFKDIQIKRKDNSKDIIKDWSSEINAENFVFSAYITAQRPN